MGGRQKGKKVVDVINEQTDSAEKAENITAGIMRSHKVAASAEQEAKTRMRPLLGSLIDARIDDPRAISLSPKDPSLILGQFDVRSEPASVHKLKFSELKQSLENDGQQKPIIVTPRGKDLVVVVGNRRLDAAIKADLDKIYALKVDLTDEQAWYLSLLSNLDNRLPMVSLSEDEEAAAIDKLITEYGWTQEEAATELHRSQSWVSRRVRTLKVDPDVDRMVQEGQLTQSHLEEIITLPRQVQGEVANAIKYYDDDGSEQLLSVAATRKMVNAIKPFMKGKTAEEIREWELTDDFDKVLDFEQYLEKAKQPEAKTEELETPELEAKTDVTKELEPQGGISEQLFGKHVSGEVPADVAATADILPGKPLADSSAESVPSAKDLETAETLDSIATHQATAPYRFEVPHVNLESDGSSMTFNCPNCHAALSIKHDAVEASPEREEN